METDLDILERGMRRHPVDVIGMIQEMGISFISEPLDHGYSGEISYNSGRYTIRVNANDGPQRQRFTAAHELAHYLLHRDLLHVHGCLNRHSDVLFGNDPAQNPAQPFSPNHEVEANKLAAEIIMPKTDVLEAYDAELDNVAEVAKKFGVSQAAMKIRLKILGVRTRMLA